MHLIQFHTSCGLRMYFPMIFALFVKSSYTLYNCDKEPDQRQNEDDEGYKTYVGCKKTNADPSYELSIVITQKLIIH